MEYSDFLEFVVGFSFILSLFSNIRMYCLEKKIKNNRSLFSDLTEMFEKVTQDTKQISHCNKEFIIINKEIDSLMETNLKQLKTIDDVSKINKEYQEYFDRLAKLYEKIDERTTLTATNFNAFLKDMEMAKNFAKGTVNLKLFQDLRFLMEQNKTLTVRIDILEAKKENRRTIQ